MPGQVCQVSVCSPIASRGTEDASSSRGAELLYVAESILYLACIALLRTAEYHATPVAITPDATRK